MVKLQRQKKKRGLLGDLKITRRKTVGRKGAAAKLSAHTTMAMAADNQSVGVAALAMAYRCGESTVRRELKCAASFAYEAQPQCFYVFPSSHVHTFTCLFICAFFNCLNCFSHMLTPFEKAEQKKEGTEEWE